ncbi:hypothetical protein F383_01000 [Gossypium arboreum]|uniref:Uncharacterized protein n=1 Tax=Gossypium arboreum TaxID=29729 RepID=A0A0B0ND78_GOSAR|nr:hypothetical protein F383_01000 [Gossypium arboreum]
MLALYDLYDYPSVLSNSKWFIGQKVNCVLICITS